MQPEGPARLVRVDCLLGQVSHQVDAGPRQEITSVNGIYQQLTGFQDERLEPVECVE